MAQQKRLVISKAVIHALLIIFTLLCILPMLLVLVVSVTDETCIGRYGCSLFPQKLSLAAYGKLFYPGSSIYLNNWFNAVMLLDDKNLYPLQMLLFRLQSDTNTLSQMATQGVAMPTHPAESFKMSTVVVTIGPLALLYPFLQKYFVKGIMIGSVKG